VHEYKGIRSNRYLHFQFLIKNETVCVEKKGHSQAAWEDGHEMITRPLTDFDLTKVPPFKPDTKLNLVAIWDALRACKARMTLLEWRQIKELYRTLEFEKMPAIPFHWANDGLTVRAGRLGR
jgi:hypothetical protein